MVKRLRHHPFTVVTGVRFPLESPKYGRFARPYFFGESHPCYAYCFAIRDRLHARVSRHYRASPLPNLGGRCKAIPLGVTIPGLLTRYFFGESSPCYAYCFAIRDRLFLFRARFAARHSDFIVSLEQRYYLSSRSMRICASPFPIGNRCKASCLHKFSRIDPFCESCSTVPCYVRLDFPRRKEYNCQSHPVVKFSLFCLTYLEHCIIITIASEPPDR